MNPEETKMEKIDTLVVGAGQAGVAISEHLCRSEVPHLVLERDRIAERWRTARWDSLVANGPAWHDRFPNLEFAGIDPDSFAGKEEVADYFVAYAEKFKAPIRCGVEVIEVCRIPGQSGFTVQTSEGLIEAKNVVAATGPFQQPVIPPVVPVEKFPEQIHSNSYRNPQQLPNGAVLVVGAGSSGAQIAEELMRSGRTVYLSVGPHDRPPRSYRGRDFVWWLGVLGKWDLEVSPQGSEHVTISVSGANGGRTVDFRRFAAEGMNLLGMTRKYEHGVLHFAADLEKNITNGDDNYLSVLAEADAYVDRYGVSLPQEPEAHIIGSNPDCVTNPVLQLELEEAGVTSIIWATGYSADYSWLKVDTFDQSGIPMHKRGVSNEPGVYFLGLPWQSRRGSSFIWGVWHDAKYLVDHITTRQSYNNYHSQSLRS